MNKWTFECSLFLVLVRLVPRTRIRFPFSITSISSFGLWRRSLRLKINNNLHSLGDFKPGIIHRRYSSPDSLLRRRPSGSFHWSLRVVFLLSLNLASRLSWSGSPGLSKTTSIVSTCLSVCNGSAEACLRSVWSFISLPNAPTRAFLAIVGVRCAFGFFPTWFNDVICRRWDGICGVDKLIVKKGPWVLMIHWRRENFHSLRGIFICTRVDKEQRKIDHTCLTGLTRLTDWLRTSRVFTTTCQHTCCRLFKLAPLLTKRHVHLCSGSCRSCRCSNAERRVIGEC